MREHKESKGKEGHQETGGGIQPPSWGRWERDSVNDRWLNGKVLKTGTSALRGFEEKKGRLCDHSVSLLLVYCSSGGQLEARQVKLRTVEDTHTHRNTKKKIHTIIEAPTQHTRWQRQDIVLVLVQIYFIIYLSNGLQSNLLRSTEN